MGADGEARERTWDGGEGDFRRAIEEDTKVLLAYAELAARSVRAEHEAFDVAAEIHVFRQRIHHEDEEGAIEDDRGGVRVELRSSAHGGPPCSERVAGGDAASLMAREPAERLGAKLARRILRSGGSSARPDGVFPVVFAAGACGALVHEIGHLLEEDHARLPDAPFSRGSRIAPPEVTIIDDPSACRGRGTYMIDDEGITARAVTLVEGGRFAGTLASAGLDSGKNGLRGTGHGRRASYRDPPLPRMGCTFMAPGRDDPEAIVSGTDRGLFVESLVSGDVDPGSGTITLIIDQGYLIEGGRLTRPVRDCLIATSAVQLLESIDAIGTDLRFDFGTGNCVKFDQPLAVVVGMPTLRARVVRVMAP